MLQRNPTPERNVYTLPVDEIAYKSQEEINAENAAVLASIPFGGLSSQTYLDSLPPIPEPVTPFPADTIIYSDKLTSELRSASSPRPEIDLWFPPEVSPRQASELVRRAQFIGTLMLEGQALALPVPDTLAITQRTFGLGVLDRHERTVKVVSRAVPHQISAQEARLQMEAEHPSLIPFFAAVQKGIDSVEEENLPAGKENQNVQSEIAATAEVVANEADAEIIQGRAVGSGVGSVSVRLAAR